MSQLRETQPTDHGVPSELLGPGEQPGPPMSVPRSMTPENTGDLPPGDFVTRGRGPTVYRTEQGTVHLIEWIEPDCGAECSLEPGHDGACEPWPAYRPPCAPADGVAVLRSDSGEHAVIVGATVEPVTATAQPPAAIGRPIGILGLAQSALEALTEPGDDDPAELTYETAAERQVEIVAQRLARFGVRGVPGSAFMHPVVEHVLRLTGAERVYLADDGRALVICKFGVSAFVPLPAAVAEFVTEYDGPDRFPYPALYALPADRMRARAS